MSATSECHEDGAEATGGPKTGSSTIQLRSIARPTILRLRTCWSFHSGQLLYSLIPIMIIEPAATTIVADRRPLFEDSNNGCPSPMISLHMR